MRRKRKDTTVSSVPELSGDDPLGINRIPDVQANPESAYSQAESHEILRALLDKMNPLLREALTMTYYDELSIAEASSALRAPSGTYKARLFRARRLLEKLAEYQARCYAPFCRMLCSEAHSVPIRLRNWLAHVEPGSAASQQ